MLAILHSIGDNILPKCVCEIDVNENILVILVQIQLNMMLNNWNKLAIGSVLICLLYFVMKFVPKSISQEQIASCILIFVLVYIKSKDLFVSVVSFIAFVCLMLFASGNSIENFDVTPNNSDILNDVEKIIKLNNKLYNTLPDEIKLHKETDDYKKCLVK